MNSTTKRGSYPHPVLDSSDDVESTIEMFNVTVAPSFDDVEIRFRIRMNDIDLRQLVDAGLVRYTFRWKCGATLSSGEFEPHRVAGHLDGDSFVAFIPQELIRRSVRVEVRVVAVQSLAEYQLARQHPDYGGASFFVSPGDVLADAGSFSFEAHKLWDPLNPPVGSCFRFEMDKSLPRGVEVRFHEDEHVVVAFSESTFPGLQALASTARKDLQVSLIVLPALMESIDYIKRSEESAEAVAESGKSWYRTILSLIEQFGSTEDASFNLAQKILDNPLDISLSLAWHNDEDES